MAHRVKEEKRLFNLNLNLLHSVRNVKSTKQYLNEKFSPGFYSLNGSVLTGTVLLQRHTWYERIFRDDKELHEEQGHPRGAEQLQCKQ